MERCATPLATRKMQINVMSCHFTPGRMAGLKQSLGKAMEKVEPSHKAGANEKDAAALEASPAVPESIRQSFSKPNSSALLYLSRKIENKHPQDNCFAICTFVKNLFC
jgi:hypothetical protein